MPTPAFAVPGIAQQPVDRPLVPAVVGGGLVFVQMADLAVAADNTVFSYPEAKVGYSGGLISALAARIPHKIAMELLLVGGSIDAKRAYEIGMINRIVPAAELAAATMKYARRLSLIAPEALAAANSSGIQPDPTPTFPRPFDSWSMVAICSPDRHWQTGFAARDSPSARFIP